MSLEPRGYLRHILVEADSDFLGNDTPRRAFVRSLEIIGQAAKKVPDGFRALHPRVEWRGMARMRDRLIHDYFGVDYDLVWDVVQKKVPPLAREIRRILEAWRRRRVGSRRPSGDPAPRHTRRPRQIRRPATSVPEPQGGPSSFGSRRGDHGSGSCHEFR